MEVTDRINLIVENNPLSDNAFIKFNDYICSETLAKLSFSENIGQDCTEEVELLVGISISLLINKQ